MDDETPKDKNIFKIMDGGKSLPEDPDKVNIPVNDYVIYATNDHAYSATGFLIFTSHHVAVMRDNGEGAVPVLVVPLNMVESAQLDEDEDEYTDNV